MESRQLRCFLAVMQHRNITAAAATLHMTQPALSKNIHRLEQELGVPLFERRAGGVVPTRFGHALAHRARLIEQEFEHARDEVEAMKHGASGTVRVGAGPLWTVRYLPQAIVRLRRQQPDARIRLTSGVLDTLVPQLLEGELDLVCAALDFPDHPEIVKEFLFDVEHVVLARDDHPLATNPVVQPGELLAYPWVALTDDYVGTTRIASYFSANGLDQPFIAVESGTLDGVLAVLREGDFVASVSAPLAPWAKALGLRSLPVTGTFWRFRAGVAYRRTTQRAPLANALIAQIKSLHEMEREKPSTAALRRMRIPQTL